MRHKGLWYWLILSNPEFLFPAKWGMFGEGAREDAQTALEDLESAMIVLLPLAVVIIVVVIIYHALT
jgi:hypothetical protein